MPLPLHLWLPRAVAWAGVIAVLFLLVGWLMIPSPPQEVLWNAGGIWAFTRVTQFLLMTRGAQAVLIWVGGRQSQVEASE